AKRLPAARRRAHLAAAMTPRARIVALIPAAGGGSRFGSRLPKQYADLDGRPLLVRAIDRLAAGAPLDRVVVALAPDDALYDRLGGRRVGVTALYTGGASRAETVANSLAAMAEDCRDDDWVMVHDAARPCVPIDALNRLIAELADDAVGG